MGTTRPDVEDSDSVSVGAGVGLGVGTGAGMRYECRLGWCFCCLLEDANKYEARVQASEVPVRIPWLYEIFK